MKNTIILLFVFAIFMHACHQSPEKIEKQYFSKAINQINMDIDSRYQWLVILPGIGCGGCIQEAEDFMKKYIANEQILFVLTRVSSLKILQQKTGVNVYEHSNIYIDKDDLFSIPTNNNIYPCVIRLNDGKIVSHSFQNPSNGAFSQLKRQL